MPRGLKFSILLLLLLFKQNDNKLFTLLTVMSILLDMQYIIIMFILTAYMSGGCRWGIE